MLSGVCAVYVDADNIIWIGSLTRSPVATLEALHGLAVAGDIEALSQQLAELVQNNDEYAPFIEQLQQLAQEFRLRRIREILKEALA